MSKSTATASEIAPGEESEPGSSTEGEARHPLRATFACWLDPKEVERVEFDLWKHWDSELEREDFSGPGLATQLAAAAVDLRRTAAVLAHLGDTHRGSALEGSELHLSMLADPRAIEVEAIAERIELCLTWRATRARSLPPGLGDAALAPSTYRHEPVVDEPEDT